jgi:hypothetical protein
VYFFFKSTTIFSHFKTFFFLFQTYILSYVHNTFHNFEKQFRIENWSLLKRIKSNVIFYIHFIFFHRKRDHHLTYDEIHGGLNTVIFYFIFYFFGSTRWWPENKNNNFVKSNHDEELGDVTWEREREGVNCVRLFPSRALCSARFLPVDSFTSLPSAAY